MSTQKRSKYPPLLKPGRPQEILLQRLPTASKFKNSKNVWKTSPLKEGTVFTEEEYKGVFNKLTRIINRYDPMSFMRFGCDPNEYNLEVRSILKKFRSVMTQREFQDLVLQEFIYFFSESEKDQKEVYDKIGGEFNRWYRRYRKSNVVILNYPNRTEGR
jgi:hypothetical protein